MLEIWCLTEGNVTEIQSKTTFWARQKNKKDLVSFESITYERLTYKLVGINPPHLSSLILQSTHNEAVI